MKYIWFIPLLLLLFFIPFHEPFANFYHYPQPDSCQKISYLSSIHDTWFNPSGQTWVEQHPSLSFQICRLKNSDEEIPDLLCSMCKPCGLLIDNQSTKHCVPADPISHTPKDKRLANLLQKNNDTYIWVHQNKIHSAIQPYSLTVS